MKMIVAILRPEKLQAVKDALKEEGINGMTITRVTGRGSQSGVRFTTRAGEFCVDEIEKVKLEIVQEDERIDTAVAIIRRVAATDHIGDGRIFILPVERSLRIRTGD
ncbi:MAG: P-II family nitrogen regulator [Candidatus Methanomethylophilaceae archaeon]|jgi:nitrogen regulatory protein P-II 1|nr:P-II family nitrogen regulator [Candidatus Methanomethylophilaceae archaeon]NLF34051.1 P-II family nitrogen regulator [Thermoplasmatales archaeon]